MTKAMSELRKHKPCQRDLILDGGEIKPAAQAHGPALHQERKDGMEFELIHSNHGPTIWKAWVGNFKVEKEMA